MKTNNLRINQLSPEAYERYLTYLQVMDHKDVESYGTYLAGNVEMYFNNHPFGRGKETILGGLRQYWESFKTVEHDLNQHIRLQSALRIGSAQPLRTARWRESNGKSRSLSRT
jgi:hypothetical protein